MRRHSKGEEKRKGHPEESLLLISKKRIEEGGRPSHRGIGKYEKGLMTKMSVRKRHRLWFRQAKGSAEDEGKKKGLYHHGTRSALRDCSGEEVKEGEF